MVTPSTVRIVGAGLAGVAVADALLSRGVSCLLIDEKGPAAGASGAASGLLHPLPGLRAQMPWRGDQAFELALQSVQRRASRDPGVVVCQGVFRPVTANQRADFERAAREGWAKWCDRGPPTAIPLALAREGLWMEQGCVVDVPRYLAAWIEDLRAQGLQTHWGEAKAWHDNPAQWVTVWCTGHQAIGRLPVACQVVRGQALVIEPPAAYQAHDLQCGVAGRAYLAPFQGKWLIGATFEHGILSQTPDPDTARQALAKRVEEMWPGGGLLDQPIHQIHVGHRCSSPDHFPICGQLDSGDWVLTALGSKGLLYHRLVATALADAMVRNAPDAIPAQISVRRWTSGGAQA
jgi:glycine/D-amino acid oxidase-like deaminating enzyme